MSLSQPLTDWLLDTDPALRWQVERDLLDEPEEVWRSTRARVVREGFGARLLRLQDEDGQWAGGAFFPTRRDPRAEVGDVNVGQPWVATTPTLSLLRQWGADPQALGDTAEKLRANSRWEYDDLPYWHGEVDVCINAETLATGTWLGADVTGLARWFPEHEAAEGGWNCEWVEGSARASIHSTLNGAVGLLYREMHGGDALSAQERELLTASRHRAEEYLLTRHLLRRLSTAEPVIGEACQFGYPFRWHYDILRALDHVRLASEHDGRAPDPRLAEAVEIVRGLRQEDGSWLQQVRHEGQEWFAVDVPVGMPSPWLTLYGTRVLDWWDGRKVA
ncbi:squalene cyclase [Ornithinimicrobium sp. Y1847]|uniref:squalene cyclase n=1 Tax=Ornithinimicrobium sp. Y1847 TaxID=3405419 RepID=UPI003B6752C2